MNKNLIVLGLSIGLLSCNQTTKEVSVKEQIILTEAAAEPTKPEETEVWGAKPKTVTVDARTGIPSDAIVLFDGTNFDEWISATDSTAVKWDLNKDGSMTVKDKAGDIQTKRNFGSVQLHLEWRSNPAKRLSGQNRSNSGVFLQNRYEVQILDNNDNGTYVNGQVGAIYKQAIPLAKASSPTGDWNAYDIIYHQPVFDDKGKLAEKATITVLHNGVLVQDHFQIQGTTEYIGWPKNNVHGKQPIKLQDHQDQSGVSFKNIWIRELED
jgi:hypothetical protein